MTLTYTGPSGTLQHIIRHRNSTALGFYVAFLDGLLGTLYVGLRTAFERFEKSGDWVFIEKALERGHQRAVDYADSIVDLYSKGKHKKDDAWTLEAVAALIPKARF